MSKKILVGRGFSQYNVLCQATDEICQGFINAGYQTEVIDFHLPNAYEQFQKCLHNPDNYSFYFLCRHYTGMKKKQLHISSKI